MQPDTIKRLIDLNHQFYQTFTLQFSATRQRLQPGVQRVLAGLPGTARLLDLGCGNGELAHVLAGRGYQGEYLGLDFSAGLLEQAAASLAAYPGAVCKFQQADLTSSDWDTPLHGYQPDLVLAFSVLHHLPDLSLRRQVAHKARLLLPPGGQFTFSVWQFLNSPRLKARIQNWESIGLSYNDVDDGDYLLDWRQGGSGLRYVHHFSPSELEALAAENGFRVIDMFLSDGEGGRLGLYQTWEPVSE